MSVQMLSAALLGSAETSLNQLLQQDPRTLRRLAALSGKAIRLEINQPTLTITLFPGTAGLDLFLHSEGPADLTLTGKAQDFIQMASAKNSSDKLFGKGISISGDTGLATEFSNLLKNFSIDWEAWLGDLVGDTFAQPLASFIRNQKQQASNIQHSLTANSVEYLQEELGILPPRAEIEGFLEAVDQLRDATERLEARINALRHHR
ncbi:ubiquinone anaerobic biosynthesis accessory factor UbiT [Nitrincola sp.]|uniref:ubiquinone anaerobic biosynthesis accessory factor UbiT n=1 Tax=Nitrincola sp. TaxID=1926584 RepID=UPI003A91ACB2